MALFENYERRIDKINKVLAENGIASLEEAKQICDDKGVDVAGIVRGVQYRDIRVLCRELVHPDAGDIRGTELRRRQLRQVPRSNKKDHDGKLDFHHGRFGYHSDILEAADGPVHK